MSDSTSSVLMAVVAALKANATLTALVGGSSDPRIYTDVPDNEDFPYVLVSIQSGPFDTKTTTGMDHTVQVAAYSRKPTPSEAVLIRQAVYNILNRGEAALSSAGVWRSIFSGVGPLLKESDGKTWQALAQFTVTTG